MEKASQGAWRSAYGCSYRWLAEADDPHPNNASHPVLKVGAGADSVFRALRAALNLGQKAYKGSTVMGRALSKHAGRKPEIWGKMAGAMRTWNDQAVKHFLDTVRGPGKFKEVTNQDGAKFLEKALADGRVCLNMNGVFKGFIDK